MDQVYHADIHRHDSGIGLNPPKKELNLKFESYEREIFVIRIAIQNSSREKIFVINFFETQFFSVRKDFIL